MFTSVLLPIPPAAHSSFLSFLYYVINFTPQPFLYFFFGSRLKTERKKFENGQETDGTKKR